MLGPGKVEKRIFLRGQALLLLADGVAPPDIAKLLGVSVGNVRKWKRRFTTDNPLERLVDAPRSGRPPSLSPRRTAPRS
jgi:transposase